MFEDVNQTWSEFRRLQVAAQEARLVRAALREVRCIHLAFAREQIAFAKAVLAASRRVDRTRYDNRDE